MEGTLEYFILWKLFKSILDVVCFGYESDKGGADIL